MMIDKSVRIRWFVVAFLWHFVIISRNTSRHDLMRNREHYAQTINLPNLDESIGFIPVPISCWMYVIHFLLLLSMLQKLEYTNKYILHIYIPCFVYRHKYDEWMERMCVSAQFHYLPNIVIQNHNFLIESEFLCIENMNHFSFFTRSNWVFFFGFISNFSLAISNYSSWQYRECQLNAGIEFIVFRPTIFHSSK